MNISKKQKSDIISKRAVLAEAAKVLKSEFVGLDLIIDEIISIMQSWYLFPGGQLRPAIVNLFGMTGVGKTSLVRRLAELINMEKKFFKFDVGDYCSGDMKLRYDMSSKLKNHEKQPVMLVFDEFQLGRTIVESGVEQDRNGLRAIWDLLDSGKFHIMNDNYYSGKLMTVIMKLDECIRDGVEAKNGVITKNKNIHNAAFYPDGRKHTKTGRKIRHNDGNDEIDRDILVPDEHHYSLYALCEKQFVNEGAITAHLLTLDEKQTMEFLYKVLEKSIEPIEHDFSQSIIFIIGNVDEAYAMSDNVDPDVDADIFYENSIKITVPHIKNALLKRFRAEQIARLGNNFVIYPAFNSQSYKSLIIMELARVGQRVYKDFGVAIAFHQSINDIIYKESVFPTQGTRPVFTTINCMIESYVCRMLAFMAENMPDTQKIQWEYSNDEYQVTFYDKKGKEATEKYPIKLKVENLRRSSLDEEQANTAIHESGHAILSSLILELIPDEMVSRTAGMSQGFCRTDMPEFKTKSFLEKDIIVTFGGYAAETLVFGEDNLTNGSYSDIERATGIAMECIRSCGMGDTPIRVSVPDMELNTRAYFNYEESDKQAKKLINLCKKKAFKCIKDNMLLLLKLGEYLSTNPRMTKAQIAEFVIKYNSYGKKEFKTKENYYGFRQEIKHRLIKEEVKHSIKLSKQK